MNLNYVGNYIINKGKYLDVQDIVSYYKLKMSEDYREVLDKCLNALQEVKDLKNINILEFITSLDMNIENIEIDYFIGPFYKTFFDDALKELELQVGEVQFKKEINSYKEALDFSREFKNIRDFYWDKGLVNFTQEQHNQSKSLNEYFNNELLISSLNTYKKGNKNENN